MIARKCFCKSDIYLPKSKPILLGILYSSPSKSNFVKHINNVFTETGILYKQECYLLGDLNINLLFDEREILINKSYRTNGQSLPPTKDYLGFCFSFSLKQLISASTRVTSKTDTLIDHALTNSSHKVSQIGVIELGISDHTILYTVQEKHLRLSSIKTMTHLLG